MSKKAGLSEQKTQDTTIKGASSEASKTTSVDPISIGDLTPNIPGWDQFALVPQEKKETDSQPNDSEPEPSPVSAEEADGDDQSEDSYADTSADEEPSTGWPQSAQRRVDKLTAQKKERDAKIADLEAKLAEKPAQSASKPTEREPLDTVMTLEELHERVKNAQKVKSWAMRHLSGGNVEVNGEDQYIEQEKVQDYLATADELLTIHAPKRAQFIQMKSANETEAKKVYPKLFDPESPEHKAFQTALRQFPEMQRYPNVALIIGDALRGQAIRMGAAKKPVNGGNGEVKAPRIPTNGEAPPKVSLGQRENRDRMKALAESGGGFADLESLAEGLLK